LVVGACFAYGITIGTCKVSEESAWSVPMDDAGLTDEYRLGMADTNDYVRVACFISRLE